MHNLKWLKTCYNLIIPEYLLITTAGSLLAAIMISGTLIFNNELLFGILAYSFAMLGFNVFNMIIDRDLDKINKPLRPIPSQAVSIQSAKLVTLIFYFIALFFAYFATYFFQLFFIAYVVACLLYTSPFTYAKKHHFATPLFGAIFYGAMPYFTAYASLNYQFQPEVFAFYVISIAAISSLKDIEDMEGEKQLGHKSMAINHSKSTVIKIAGAGLAISLAPIALVQFFLRKNTVFVVPLILGLILIGFFYFKIEKQRFLAEHAITQSKLVTAGMAVALCLQALIATSYLLLD